LRLTPEEHDYQLQHVGCRTLITLYPDEAGARKLTGHKRRLIALGAVQRPDLVDSLDWSPIPESEIKRYRAIEVDLKAVAAILFTSGTSGKPKAVQLTYGNFYASAQASAARLGTREDDRWLLCLPLYHVGGLSILFRSALTRTPFVVLDRGYTIQTISDIILKERVTVVSLVPTQLHRMLQAGFEPPPYLRLILLGGASASPELLHTAAERNIPIATTYGLTEACSQVATMPPDEAPHKPGSVGKPLRGTTVRILDEQGHDQPPGEYGEIVVSGPTVMKGYLGLPKAGGIFHTGDIGYLDAEGDLWVVQRRTDLIVTGGENVYPAEVESVLRQQPSVEEVCVVGIPNAEWGQQVAAAIAIKPGHSLTTDELTAFAREHLAGYKVPRRVLFVSALPMTASGKIERKAVAALFAHG
ncbi:MAG: o-succinylbenzoate--CoA ligase, partial [Anaerolineae bacterium]